MKNVLFIFMLLMSTLSGGLLPDYDSNCDHLKSFPTPVIPSELSVSEFLDRDVPKIIHQIWFGDPSKKPELTKGWESYTSQGWQYRLWTEKDLDEAATFVSKRNLDLIKTLISKKNWWAASDILRYELIRHMGGIYIDCDFHAPTFANKSIPIEAVFRMKGVTFVTEHHGRNIGSNSALFVMNGILVAPPNHPIFSHACETIEENINAWKGAKKDVNAMYSTGPFFLNRIINGPIQLLTIQYIQTILID
jgi:mannosyltransferase OCH1-like enzyme